jgi:hypothetical protein
MPLPREKHDGQLNWASIAAEKSSKKISTVALAIETHLLNILPDDKERSDIGVERGLVEAEGELLREVSSFAREDDLVG